MDMLDVHETLCDGELDDCDDDEGIQRLVEGLNLKSLSTSGSEFSVQVNEDKAIEIQHSYEGPKIFDHVNMDCIGQDDSNEMDASFSCDTPFNILALKMSDLTPDGKVKKKILSEGYGEVVPSNALVWFHHNNYKEMDEVPFDSSYLRGHTTMIRLNSGKAILGLDIGLSTMKREEKAEFLIHPDYAYGKLGVPPRIPPDAHILVRVEMKKFVDNALALKMGEYTDEELKSLPFEEIYKGALALLLEGKHSFCHKKYHHAVQLYRKALRSLENCDMKSDEDDMKNQELRLRLFTNLGVSLNKMGSSNSHKQAINACRNALRLNPKQEKALYHLAVAHLQLGNTDEARKYAMFARQYSPRDTVISALLQKIDFKMNKYKTASVTFAKNAFKSISDNKEKKETPSSNLLKTNQSVHNNREVINGSPNQTTCSGKVKIIELNEDVNTPEVNKSKESSNVNPAVPHSQNTIGSEFELESISYIEEFCNDPTERQLMVPSGLTYEEELFFKKQANLYGLRCNERHDPETGKTIMVLLK